MKKIKIENGKLYSSRMPLCEGIDVFEIVEKIPENYFIWNIGENMGQMNISHLLRIYTLKTKTTMKSIATRLKPSN